MAINSILSLIEFYPEVTLVLELMEVSLGKTMEGKGKQKSHGTRGLAVVLVV